ncbi:DNA repair protein RadC [Rubrimonas cliftonensis]|uniref:DNA repair protein RadC n=2 Tax=Rubrimonas cliftonensis TaxID=89524 RepID=A0A1H4ET32_9RHOB|nr:DNA repair protein RadC [Rubrimonas cliftonensis]
MLEFLRALLRLPEPHPTRRYPPRSANFFTEDGKPHYHGHRARLRQRFLATWPDGLPDYELLELVLCNAIWKIDVKPLAKKLLERFGSINAVVNAPEARLREIPGVDDWVVLHLRLAGALAQRLARAELNETCVLGSWSALIAYCRTTMAFRDREQFRVLYLDQRNTLIEDRLFAEGTVNATPVYPREVARQGLALNAVSVILVHNHPSGDPKPSDTDVVMTRRVVDACAAVDIRVIDHVVIGNGAEASFRTLKLL